MQYCRIQKVNMKFCYFFISQEIDGVRISLICGTLEKVQNLMTPKFLIKKSLKDGSS
jgi:hypothetical protein